MTAPQPGLSPEYAVAMRGSMLQGLARELEITKRVLAAVPDGQRAYRPDPKGRSAWELASRILRCPNDGRNRGSEVPNGAALQGRAEER